MVMMIINYDKDENDDGNDDEFYHLFLLDVVQ
jgi:hypothetical protein